MSLHKQYTFLIITRRVFKKNNGIRYEIQLRLKRKKLKIKK